MKEYFKLYYTSKENPTEVLKVYFTNRLAFHLRKNFLSAVRREVYGRIYLDLPFSTYSSVVKPVLDEFATLYLPQDFHISADVVDIFTKCECISLEVKYNACIG